jgi:hypothetical protein
MTIKVRPGDLESDRDVAIALLRRHVNPAYDGARFDWLYRANPAGRGRLWMAVDGATGDVVGTAGALPRWLSLDGRDVQGWLLADFCMAERHRALGPALQLQRACLEDLAADGAPVWYDLPGRSMEAVYRRLGLTPAVRLQRFIRPVRSYPALRARLRSPLLAGPLAVVTDLALAWGTGARPPVEVTRHEGRCGAAFDALAREAAPAYGAAARRDAAFLNWRYLDNPFCRHEILIARRDGHLVGYAAVTTERETPAIVDLFGIAVPPLLEGLLRGTVGWLRRRGAISVTLWLHAPPAWGPILHRAGFRARETAPVMLHEGSAPARPGRLDPTSAWFLTHGDGDG